jgi:hypothetical protein
MTDNTPWTPPASVGGREGAPPAPFTPPADAAAASPPRGGPSQPTDTGWTPPPKPGLIPLRPLTLGAILGASFQVLRRNPRPTFGFALLITGTISVIALAVVGALFLFAFSRSASASADDAPTIDAGSTAIIILSYLALIAGALIGSALLQGIISLEVARAAVGEKLTLGALWKAARGRLGALIGWTAALVVAAVIALVVLTAVVVAIIALGGIAGVVIGTLLGLGFAAGATVLGVWLGVRLSLVPSVLMIERRALGAALRRSWSLTVGYFWRTFGIVLLVTVIVQVVSSILSIPLSIVLGIAGALIAPTGDYSTLAITTVVIGGITVVVTLVVGAITAVVQAATPALIYLDLRMRKEGLDLELSKFVEARQAGKSPDDPYLTTPATTTAQTGTPGSATGW